jgi:hypothetical protein
MIGASDVGTVQPLVKEGAAVSKVGRFNSVQPCWID